MSASPIIRVQNVSFSYHTEPVLLDINLDINKGDYLGVIGPNGGGKTTLLKLMLGLLKPSGGSIELFGRPARSFREWSRIGYVPQKATSIESRFPFTVEEVVAFGRVARAGIFHFLGADDREAVTRALEQVKMLPQRKSLLAELSGGQQQRVFIAKGLVSQPDILILDEPTVGVDVQAQEEFYRLLSRLNTQGITLVVVSHDIDVIANEVRSVACLNQALISHGTPEEFVTGDYLEKVYGKSRKFILHGH